MMGEHQMKAEIFARGPIACSLNSDPPQFNLYRGGIITCDIEKEELCARKLGATDHVVVIAGWGVDKESGKKYWVGRNSYGTQVNSSKLISGCYRKILCSIVIVLSFIEFFC